jgi:hypothetical protein
MLWVGWTSFGHSHHNRIAFAEGDRHTLPIVTPMRSGMAWLKLARSAHPARILRSTQLDVIDHRSLRHTIGTPETDNGQSRRTDR